jgi:hypothetical protein
MMEGEQEMIAKKGSNKGKEGEEMKEERNEGRKGNEVGRKDSKEG